MRLSTPIVKLSLLLGLFLFTSIVVYAATTISNPLCSLEQVTNLPAGGYYMSAISGNGLVAAGGSSPEGSTTHVWNLSTNSLITTLSNAAYPVLDYDGNRIAFYSQANLAGQNADGSYEVYLWDSGSFIQVTNLTGTVTISPPDISADGTKIVFGLNTNGASGYNTLYLWREGVGLEVLASNTVANSLSAIRLSSDGSHAVFLHSGNLTGADAQGKGAFYSIDLSTQIISHLLNIDVDAYPMEFFVIDGDGSRLAFHSSANLNNLNASNALRLYVWDASSGLSALSNGSGTPSYPYVLPLGFSDDGQRLLFASAFNPTGENPDGSVEYYAFEYPSSIRQLSSKTGMPYVYPAHDGISANGTKMALILPTGTDYALGNPAYFDDIELFEGTCSPTATVVLSPTNLQTTTIAQTSLALAWTDNATNESNYLLERSLNSGATWTQIVSLGANISTYTNSSLTCNTAYQYRVRAYRSADSIHSSYSNVLSVSTAACAAAPTSPSNLRTNTIAQTSLALAWDDNASDETAYYVERSLNSGATWTQIASLGANITSYINSSLTCNTAYQYRVRAYRSSGASYSGYSNVLSVSTTTCPTPPTSPSNLRTTSIGQTSLVLAWDDNATNESNYLLERSLNSGATWTQIVSLGANISTYTNSSLTCNTAYQYRVRAYRSAESSYSTYSNVLSVSTAACPPPPTSPSNLRITTIAETSLALAWDDNASDESNYLLERSLNSGATWSQIVSLGFNVTSYTNSSLTCNTAYQYRVRAYRSGDSSYSSYSNVLSVSTAGCPPINPPSNLRKTSGTRTSLSLAWNDNTNQETGYRLERSDDAGTSWTQIVSLGANVTSYTNSNLTCNTSYQYRVRAYRSADNSYTAYSNALVISTSACPPVLAPDSLRKLSLTQTSVLLRWDDNASDETAYYVERSLDAGVTWTEIASLSANISEYSDTSLSCNTAYRYRVRAYRSGNNMYSAYSNVLAFSTQLCTLAAPTNLITTGVGQTSISLAWNDNASDETNYRIERSLNGGATWTQIASVGANVTSYTNNNLTCNTAYQYRVRAYRSADASFTAYVYRNATTALCSLIAPNDLRTISAWIGAYNLDVAWNDNASDESAYRLERSDDGITWTEIVSLNTNSWRYNNTGLSCDTVYDYRVRAYRAVDASYSAYSNVLNLRTLPCLYQAYNLAVELVGSDILLSWFDSSLEESSYRIERNLNGAGWIEIADSPANSTSYSDTGLNCSENVSYRVRAYQASRTNYAPYSEIVSLDCNLPASPTNLSLNIVNYAPVLTWLDNASDETHYMVEISVDNGLTWTRRQLPRNLTSFRHEYPHCGQNFIYRVRAFNYYTEKYSNPTNTVQWTTPFCVMGEAGSAIRLKVTRTSSNDARLSSVDASLVYSYVIQASTDAGQTWLNLNTMIALDYYSSATVTVQCGLSYRFRLVEVYNSGRYRYSNEVNFAPKPCGIAAITGLRYTDEGARALIAWNRHPATGAVNHRLERRILGTSEWVNAYVPNVHFDNVQNNFVSELECDTIYDYRIISFKGSLQSPPSAMLRVAGPPCTEFPAPTNLAFVSLGGGQLEISWTDNSNNETEFVLVSPYLGTYQIPANTSSYILTVSDGYCPAPLLYILRAYDAAINSYSTTISGDFAIPCASLASVTLNARAETDSAVRLAWNDVLATDGEYVIYQVGSDGEIAQYTLDDASTSYLIEGLTCGENYDFQLRARRESDDSSSLSNAVDFSVSACAPSNMVGLYNNGNWLFVDSNLTSNPAISLTLGDASWQALIGDWDGDGSDGIGFYRNGEFVLRSLVAGTLQESHFSFGESGIWQALVGDWNGDGSDSIGLYGNGEFILSDDNSTIHYRFSLGDTSGWQAVAGDWDGDGADGFALYKEGTWLMVDSALNPLSQSIAYGPVQAGWLPVAGDWNGDGSDTIGLFNNGLWRLRLSSNTEGGEISIFFGAAGDIPLGRYVGDIPSNAYASELPLPLAPEPTVEATVTPSPEATVEATSVATSEPTVGASVTPSPEATSEVYTPSPEPAAEVTPESTPES